MSLIITVVIPLLAAIYTWNYARWAASRKLGRGAAGLYLLSVLTVAVPAYVVWWVS